MTQRSALKYEDLIFGSFYKASKLYVSEVFWYTFYSPGKLL
jgi:hypothetical protein